MHIIKKKKPTYNFFFFLLLFTYLWRVFYDVNINFQYVSCLCQERLGNVWFGCDCSGKLNFRRRGCYCKNKIKHLLECSSFLKSELRCDCNGFFVLGIYFIVVQLIPVITYSNAWFRMMSYIYNDLQLWL